MSGAGGMKSRIMSALFKRGSEKRIEIIDALRGLSILLMVAYHFGYDLVAFLGAPPGLIHNPLLDILQPFFAGLFIFVSGISCRFSKNNLKRGLVMLAFGAVITAVTYIMDMPVWFGIIHFLGSAAIIFALVKAQVDRVNNLVLVFIYLGLYICSAVFTSRSYSVNYLWWLGFRPAAFASADYFPILPWIFIYLAGTLVGRYIADRKFPQWFYTIKVPFLAAVGRNTMIIYVLHQPVLYAAVMLLNFFIH